MNDISTKIKPTVPFGIYKIDKDFLNFAKNNNNAVPDPEYTNRYCGPVFCNNTKRGPLNYFIPVYPEYAELENINMSFDYGIIAGFLDARKALPCLDKVITWDDSDEKLLKICQDMKSYIKDRSLEVDVILTEKTIDTSDAVISEEKSSIPFGIYRLNKEYLSDAKVKYGETYAPDYTDRYCGPVLHVNTSHGPVDYFAPILPEYDEMTGFLMNFRNGILGGFIDFGRMLPCYEKNITPDNSDKDLIFDCNEVKLLIGDCGEFMFKKWWHKLK